MFKSIKNTIIASLFIIGGFGSAQASVCSWLGWCVAELDGTYVGATNSNNNSPLELSFPSIMAMVASSNTIEAGEIEVGDSFVATVVLQSAMSNRSYFIKEPFYVNQASNPDLHISTDCPQSNGVLNPGQSCNLKVVYNPRTEGQLLAASIHITDTTTISIKGSSKRASLNVVDYSVGEYTSCAVLKSNRLAYCWGVDSFGSIGNNSKSSWNLVSKPTVVSDVSNIAGPVSRFDSLQTCLRTMENKTTCFGNGFFGSYNSSLKTNVPRLDGFVKYAVSQKGFCVINSDTTATCNGRIPGITDGAVLKDSNSVNISNIVDIQLGMNHGCLLTAQGQVYCFGDNSYYQLTNKAVLYTTQSPILAIASNVQAISVGASQNCAVTGNGTVCWGFNNYNQINQSAPVYAGNPVYVDLPQDGVIQDTIYDQISIGEDQTCGLKNGRLYCWGNAQFGLGRPYSTTHGEAGLVVRPESTSSNLIPFEGIHSVKVGAGGKICFTDSYDDLYCFGRNSYGFLPTSSVENYLPVKINIDKYQTPSSCLYGSTCTVDNNTLASQLINVTLDQASSTYANFTNGLLTINRPSVVSLIISNTSNEAIDINDFGVSSYTSDFSGNVGNKRINVGANTTYTIKYNPVANGVSLETIQLVATGVDSLRQTNLIIKVKATNTSG